MLFPTFLLEKPCNENHISSAMHVTKATLRFWNHCVNDKCQKVDQHYTCKDFTWDREKGNAMVVATDSFVAFPLINHYCVSILQLCGKNIQGPPTAFLSQFFKPLLGGTRCRGKCWAAIQLSHCPEPSGRVIHEEVYGLEDHMDDGLFFCATFTGSRGGHTPSVQAGVETSDTGVEALLMKEWSRSSSSLPSYFRISAGMPSEPGSLLFFKLFSAADICSMEGRILLRSEIPSGMCAKLRTVAASNNRVHMPWSLHYCLFAPHICMVLFFTHIQFVVNHTINATPLERLQQHPLLFQRTAPIARSLCEGWTPHNLHILVTAPFCCDRKYRAACAQSFAPWQQATIEFTCHDHSIIACSRHIYVWCCSSRTSRLWWITQSTQHHRRGCNSVKG